MPKLVKLKLQAMAPLKSQFKETALFHGFPISYWLQPMLQTSQILTLI